MKSYRQYCGVAKALDLVGQRWTLLLVRDLLPGPRRFSDLLVPGLTPNMLSTRLKELEHAGLVERVTLPPPAARKVWALTAEGRRLEPVVLALGAFGAAYLDDPEDATVRLRWLMVSLQRRYRGGFVGTVAIHAADVPYTLRADGTRLVVRDGAPDHATLRLEGPPPAVAALLGRGHRSDAVTIEGDVDALLAALS
jgi:DNA-binding HxlR family transcriptional regulator